MTPRNLARFGGLAFTTALMAGVAAPALAGSFYLQEQSVRGMGRANSGETADVGASSLWWNAASIARSGREVYVGAHGLILDSDVDDAGSTLTYPGGATVPVSGDPHVHDVVNSGLVPNFAIAMPLILRIRKGALFEAGAWSLGRHYRWITPIAVVWIAIMCVLFLMPVSPKGVPGAPDFDWSVVNYAPLTVAGALLLFGGWYVVSARRWFKGPVNEITVDAELDHIRRQAARLSERH